MAKHTPTPWRERFKGVQDGHGGLTILSLIGPDGQTIMEKRIQGPAREEDEANFRLAAQAVNVHHDLVAAYGQVEVGFLDALHALNDAGVPCPASLALAMEKVREIIGNAKKEG